MPRSVRHALLVSCAAAALVLCACDEQSTWQNMYQSWSTTGRLHRGAGSLRLESHPIHEAAAQGDLPRLRAHLARGHSPNPRVDLPSPLSLAALGGHLKVVEELLAAGADPDGASLGKNETGMAAIFGRVLKPVQAATASGEVATVKRLLAAGATRPASREALHGALLHAAFSGRRKTIRLWRTLLGQKFFAPGPVGLQGLAAQRAGPANPWSGFRLEVGDDALFLTYAVMCHDHELLDELLARPEVVALITRVPAGEGRPLGTEAPDEKAAREKEWRAQVRESSMALEMAAAFANPTATRRLLEAGVPLWRVDRLEDGLLFKVYEPLLQLGTGKDMVAEMLKRAREKSQQNPENRRKMEELESSVRLDEAIRAFMAPGEEILARLQARRDAGQHAEVVKILLAAGADPGKTDSKKLRPAEHADKAGDPAGAALLRAASR